MAQKKEKLVNGFPEKFIREWEDSDGVNFAIALSRITGWLLHVDWLAPEDEESVNRMKSLRVYVGTGLNFVFDFTGKTHVQPFYSHIILPIARHRATMAKGGIITRYYSEADLRKLPLRVKANEVEIQKAVNAIQNNSSFLEKIPKRNNSHIPADRAAHFSFGWCMPYAAALEKVKGLPAVNLIAVKYDDSIAANKNGFFHSVAIHPDGRWEDAWGIEESDHIIERFAVSEYRISREDFFERSNRLKANSTEKYELAFKEAISYLNISE